MRVFCGIDWASDHHDMAIVDNDGKLVARARISDAATGLQQLLDLLADHGDGPDTRIPVAIEISRLPVPCLRASDRPVYAINPMAASRYGEHHTVVRKKSDHLDAMVLANILRTDAAAHRTVPADSDLPRPLPSSPVHNRTRSGTARRPATSSDPTCTSTSPATSTPFSRSSAD